MSDPASPNAGQPEQPQSASSGQDFPEPGPAAGSAHAADSKAISSDLSYRYGSRQRPASYEPASLRHIDWGAAFPFVHLFKGFRFAMHPSKLLLALTAVLLLYVGGRSLDGIWPNRHLAFHGEPQAFDQFLERGEAPRDFWQRRHTERAAARHNFDALRAEAARRQGIDPGDAGLSQIRRMIIAERDDRVTQADETYARTRESLATQNLTDADRRQRLAQAQRMRDQQVRAAHDDAYRDWTRATEFRGRGIFVEFYRYEVAQFDGIISSVLRLDAPGVLAGLWRFLYVGPLWGFSQHPIYFTLLSLWMLFLTAVFGGAIARIASVQVARDEKISLRSALRFSTGKFVSFLSAPLIPIMIIVLVGLLVALAGAVGNVPWAGEIIVGGAFILALLAGFLITLVLIGLVGGFSLMYPTIAAEGTDSFDAISRSFSYLYAKPWQLAFYGIMGLVYGVLTYLFVRLFIWLVLISSHTAAGMFIFWNRAAGDRNLLEAMWPAPPDFGTLSYEIQFINLSPTQDIGAALLAFWVYLIIALAPAYALSLYFSLSTVTYFLMRREVDATELDEVYLDPHDEEFPGYSDVPDADTDAPIEPPEPTAGRPKD